MLSLRRAPLPTNDDIVRWSLDNPGFRFEYVNGELTVSPTTGKSGIRTSALNVQLGVWAKANGYRSFGSNTLFDFNGLKVSPDEALLQAGTFDDLSAEEQDRAVSIAPDVAIEIVSKSQGWGKTRGGVLPKCEAMFGGGVRFVVMLDPYAEGEERIVTWGVPPAGFPTGWDDVLNA